MTELTALLASASACWQVPLEARRQGSGEQHPSNWAIKITLLRAEKQGAEPCPVLTSLHTFGILFSSWVSPPVRASSLEDLVFSLSPGSVE